MAATASSYSRAPERDIDECRKHLEKGGAAATQEALIKRKALERVAVLTAAAVRLCDLAGASPDGVPSKTLELVWGIDGLLRGVESVHRLLRQVCADSDAAAKPVLALRRGPLRELLGDVGDSVVVNDPVAWILLPALKAVVDCFEQMIALCAAPTE